MKALSLCILIGCVIFYLPHPFWWLELLAHFVMLSCILSAVMLIWHAYNKQYIWVSLSLVACLLSVWPMLRFVPFKQTMTHSNFSLYNANVLSDNTHVESLLTHIQTINPDVITLQEYTPKLQSKLTVLDQQYPHQILLPQNNNFGIALYSKWPIVEHHILKYPPLNLPSIEALLDTTSAVRIITTHPPPPLNQALFQARNAQMNALAKYIQSLTSTTIVAGDFNNTPFTQSFKGFLKTSELFQARLHSGLLTTWPSKYVGLPVAIAIAIAIAIDHILLSQSIDQYEMTVLNDIGSDHHPVLLRALLPTKAH